MSFRCQQKAACVPARPYTAQPGQPVSRASPGRGECLEMAAGAKPIRHRATEWLRESPSIRLWPWAHSTGQSGLEAAYRLIFPGH